MSTRSSNLKNIEFFRFKKLKGKYLLTNDVGDYVFLSDKNFKSFIDGKLNENNKIYNELKDKCFIVGKYEQQELIKKYKSKNSFLKAGTNLHIVIPTLRCNQKCSYCHASVVSVEKTNFDMDIETAKNTVDFIFQSPNPFLSIEFQGGEPLLNWEVTKFIIDYALEKNRMENRSLIITIVSNFIFLDKKKLQYLVENKVSLCTSIDGPKFIHDKNRGKSYDLAVKNLKRAIKEYSKKFDKYLPSALITITKHSLPYYKEIVDEYVKLNLQGIHVRFLNPIGFAKEIYKEISYTPDEFLKFYINTLDYIIELNKKGIEFWERTAWILLVKILTESDPNYLDIRSPCGAGIGQVAINYNGDIYTCDEGRMLAMKNDHAFRIANVHNNSYKQAMESEIIKTLCIASCLDGVPLCADCVYKPYCGSCPVVNYEQYGDIFSQMPNNDRHKILEGILDYLFIKLQDEEIKEIFKKWIKKISLLME